MPHRVWDRDPDSGGVPVPAAVRERAAVRIRSHAERHFAGRYTRLDVLFKAQFCYVDAFTEPDVPADWGPAEEALFRETLAQHVERMRATPIHLCRLRYFGDKDRWAFAMFGYSSMTYDLTMLPSGDFFGTPEEAVAAAAGLYLG